MVRALAAAPGPAADHGGRRTRTDGTGRRPCGNLLSGTTKCWGTRDETRRSRVCQYSETLWNTARAGRRALRVNPASRRQRGGPPSTVCDRHALEPRGKSMPSIAGRSRPRHRGQPWLSGDLVDEALRRGATKVHAATRQPFEHADERVARVALDLTDAASIAAAAETVGSLDILATRRRDLRPLLGDDIGQPRGPGAAPTRPLGTFDVTRAFLPALTASQGSIVNILSMSSFANMPLMPTYSISKAALLSLTQGLAPLDGRPGRRPARRVPGRRRHGHDQGLRHPQGVARVGGRRGLGRGRGRGDLGLFRTRCRR